MKPSERINQILDEYNKNDPNSIHIKYEYLTPVGAILQYLDEQHSLQEESKEVK